jgi:putative two-component system response regulator
MRVAKILIGQHDSAIVSRFGALFKRDEFEILPAANGDAVLQRVREQPAPDIVVLDHSITSPGVLDVCRALKADPQTSMIPVVLLFSEPVEDHTPYIHAGCDDILVQPVPTTFLARIQSLLRLKYLSEGLDDAESVLYTLTRTLEAKDLYTMGHADRVGHFAVDLGKALGVKAVELDLLHKGGMLHDIGKIAIPDAILTKPGKYTPEEFTVMKKHPVLGCEICEKLRSVRDALPLIRYHHEKLDGSGYPDGLAGGQIPALVRVITIVDIYDALRSRRSYKEAFSIDKSFEIMWQEVEKGWWDRDVLAAWEKLVRDKKSSI